LENFKIALGALWSNKVRAFLTILGVIIGVFAVVLLVAIGQGTKDQVAEQLTSFGTNLFFIAPGKIDTTQIRNFNPLTSLGNNTLTSNDLTALEKSPLVKNALPLSLINTPPRYQGKLSLSSIVLATYPGIFELKGMEIKQGRAFTRSDLENKKAVVVLGPNSAKDLFGEEDPLGKKINLKDKDFEVIGVVDKSPVGVRVFGLDFDNIVYLPFTTGQEFNNNSLQILRIVVQTTSKEGLDQAVEEARRIMLASHQGNDDFTVLRQEDVLKILDSVLSILTIMITAIAAISLIVGGIGIMNIMLVSVTERTKEIGLRKAVGATKVDILIQFLTESALLSLLGGLLGIGSAYGASQLIKRFFNLTPTLTPKSVLLAFGLALGIGIFFGVAPAIRAARLDPIEALRHE